MEEEILIKEEIKKIIFSIPAVIEFVVAIIISVVICIAIAGLLMETSISSIFETGGLMIFLKKATEIIIGIEFVRLIFSHTMNATFEVIIMAIVRQIIMGHRPALDTILFVFATAVLFVIRKYFFVKQIDKVKDDTSSVLKYFVDKKNKKYAGDDEGSMEEK